MFFEILCVVVFCFLMVVVIIVDVLDRCLIVVLMEWIVMIDLFVVFWMFVICLLILFVVFVV